MISSNKIVSLRRSTSREHDKGFTLLELLVVIAIMALLSIIGINNYISFQRDSQLTAFSEEFASILRTAKNKSVNAEILPGQELSDFDPDQLPFWGVAINSSNYILYENCIANDGSSCNQNVETKTFSSGYTILPTGNITFERLSGKTTAANFVLKIPGTADCSKVLVDVNGEINVVKNIGCI